ncbi:hypothetical protein SAMN05443999_103157 [Roseovarius azorensis]|uniref:Uncharacterized protein n=1 Tax=Roseovarius azorensis TaxID=1287727 RepID=A0A1H7LZF2_9RHOB|nr:hypothetical protein [Roseovarius azorensis]SEL03687.1 hypothetical protein SAMN05443999_103157 [Roseovarius azorensis]
MGKVFRFGDDRTVDGALLERIDKMAAQRIEERPFSQPTDKTKPLSDSIAARSADKLQRLVARKYRW